MLDQLESEIRQIIRRQPPTAVIDMQNCLDRLLALPPSPDQLALIECFLLGQIVPDAKLTPAEDNALLNHNGSVWGRMINLLWEQGRLNYELVKRSVWRAKRMAYCLNSGDASSKLTRLASEFGLEQSHAGWLHFLIERKQLLSDSCTAILNEYAEQLAWEMAQDFSSHARDILRLLGSLRGQQFLLLAADYYQQYFGKKAKFKIPQSTQLDAMIRSLALLDPTAVDKHRMMAATDLDDATYIAHTIIHMLHLVQLEPLSDDGYQALVDQLQTRPKETLKAILPFAYDARQVICDALGWQHAYPLISFIVSTADQTYDRNGYKYREIPNSADSASGTLRVSEAKAALEQAGRTLAYEVFDLLRQSGEHYNNSLTLIEAVTGRNRAKVEKGLKTNQQIAIKAFGLLPIEHGDEEVLQRYLALKQIAKDGLKFGQMRRVTHAAAVQAAIANLAQVAGYDDANRFEWAMEARIADSSSSGRSWQLGAYDLKLTVNGAEAQLIVERNGRQLKAIPQEVRNSESYQLAKEAVAQLRSQASRLRTELIEGLLTSGAALSPEQLQQMLLLPAAQDMFQRLIWQAESGVCGLLNAETLTLEDMHGNLHPIATPLQIVHPYALYQNNSLADWQRRIVTKHIVQPIKQAFRELYILTPAEQNTGTYSNRFAGHLVDSSVARRLLTVRGWQLEGYEDGSTPYKIFSNIKAVFDFTDVDHFFGARVPITTDRLYFQPYPDSALTHRNQHDREQDWLPLEQIPPLIFSEVMRDADLIVSVAQRDGGQQLSNEAYEQRGNLVKALLDDLGLAGVEVEGHFAHVQGKLARYRVHLGSAAIHIEPGNYLCIVPDRWGQKHDKLFLPFADENDSKTSEVISKILLLLADDRIKDESILRQICRE